MKANRNIRWGPPQVGQIRCLKDVLRALEEDVLRMSWGPILAGWNVLAFVFAVSGCVLISAFVSLVDVLIGIAISTVELRIIKHINFMN